MTAPEMPRQENKVKEGLKQSKAPLARVGLVELRRL
jgi:hypothetical protein